MFQDRVSASLGVFYFPGIVRGVITENRITFSMDAFGIRGPRLFDKTISEISEIELKSTSMGPEFRVHSGGNAFTFQASEPDLWKREFQSHGIKISGEQVKDVSTSLFGYFVNAVGILLLVGATAIVCGLLYALFHIS